MKEMHTIVQHSGFGYGNKPDFEQATETRTIKTAREVKMVKDAGGLLFDSMLSAEAFSETANYPEGHEGIVPAAKGTFSDKKIDGLAIYIPVREVVG